VAISTRKAAAAPFGFAGGTRLALTIDQLDGTIGQNAVAQAEEFNKGLGVTGLVVTKLDGTAKGGVVLAIAQKLKIPIRFVGVGEQSEDFGVFNASDFVSALLKSGPDGVAA